MPAAPRLRLSPERCDRCGACVDACPVGCIKVGPRYIYVDWDRCDGCEACVRSCERDAITSRSAPSAPRRAMNPGRASKNSGRAPGGSRGEQSAWSPLETVAVLAVALALLLGKDALLSAGALVRLPLETHVLVRTGVLVVYYAALAGFVLWLLRRKDVRVRDAFALGPIRAVEALWIPATVAGVWLVFMMYGIVTRAVGWGAPEAAASDLVEVFGPGATGLAVAVLLVVVVGPVVEEALFRGILLDSVAPFAGRAVAVIVSAVVFAGFHFLVWRLFPLIVLGIALGWIRTATGSLWSAILVHSMYNGVAVAAAFYVSGVLG